MPEPSTIKHGVKATLNVNQSCQIYGLLPLKVIWLLRFCGKITYLALGVRQLGGPGQNFKRSRFSAVGKYVGREFRDH